MVRTVWFVIKLGLLIALLVWLAEQSGTVNVAWMGYDIRMHVGLFLVGLVAIILMAIFIYNILDAFVNFPASWRRYREVRSLEKGYRAVSLGLTAVAAGDTKAAGKQAKTARKFMPDDTGLPLLLAAQAARLDGREEDARSSFAVMLEHKDTAFLGVRGLLQSALDQEDYSSALTIAEGALKTHPKQPWILKTVYDLQIKNENWDAAGEALKTLEKVGGIDKVQAVSDRAILLVVRAMGFEGQGSSAEAIKLYKAAIKIDGGLLEAAIPLVGLYKSEKKVRAAKGLIEKVWKIAPHPALADLWMGLMPVKKRDDKAARMARAEALIKMNPNHVEGYLAVAREAMDQRLWGPAREALRKAEEIEPEERVYEMLVQLEGLAGDYEEAERLRMNELVQASPAPRWVCAETGRIYAAWHWFATPYPLFGTIGWQVPEVAMRAEILLPDNDDRLADLTSESINP